MIERKDHKTRLSPAETDMFKKELIHLGQEYFHTKDIDTFFLFDRFPVDRRHNIKIDRFKLSKIFTNRISEAL